jgi:large subunit ribosomal protein L18|uniref:Large ribosomal subunit protein uL18c n=1 Tax=Guillardia theta TaxID=55529 RepID=A0A0U2L333_GUITH|nr:ribosomal protein L18 [Guillardia theta]|tara:strand:+ start:17142 stop:17504 length:363 start_codon:yes stop_codon:yes gene_type:complete
MKKNPLQSLKKVQKRIRAKVRGTAERPRLSVYRSNDNIYAQIIDDVQGKTLIASSTVDKDIKALIKSGNTCDASKLVGEAIARKSLENKIQSVVFDRGGRLYHGRVKALADGAREIGLQF